LDLPSFVRGAYIHNEGYLGCLSGLILAKKAATVLRMELVRKRVRDFGLKKSLAYWAESETHIAWAHYESH
jgi:hypothetical protein